MRIVLLGPPGAGKGSLASLCHERLGLAHLSTGEIFRREIARGTLLGRRVARYVTSGRLVPDTLVVEVMATHLRRQRNRQGFVLDGFPRTEAQARGLAHVLARWGCCLDGAVYLTSPQALLVRRLSGRRVCPRCGANYHLRTMRPKRAGFCDRCGARLTTRKDDQPQTIRKRLAIDRTASAPLIDFYRQAGLLYRVNGAGRVEAVFRRMQALFRRTGWLG